MRTTRLWRLWRKPSWEAKRLVLCRKRRQQRKLRALQKQLPDDVLAEHIFSKLSLQTLLHTRLTCKGWNRVISCRVFEGIEPWRCLVNVIHRGAGKTIALAHNPSNLEGVWRRIWWPSIVGSDQGIFEQADGPFVLEAVQGYHYCTDSRLFRPYVVHNLLTKKQHVVPVPACPESEWREVFRWMTLFGATKEDYKALMVTEIDPMPRTCGYFYAHLYSSVTDTWRLIDTRIDLGPEQGMGYPNKSVSDCRFESFDVRFLFLTLSLDFSNRFKVEGRLLAFDSQEERWIHIPKYTSGFQPSSPLQFEYIQYFICMSKLLAVATHTTRRRILDADDSKIIIYQYLGCPVQGVGTQSWKELSSMPLELTTYFSRRTINAGYRVINDTIYFKPSSCCYPHIFFNLRDNSWKEVSSVCKSKCNLTEFCLTVASEYINYLGVH